MIYFFTWNSDFLVRENVDRWKNTFISKYGDFNFVHIKDLSSVNNDFLVSSLTWISFLSEKKLVIIDKFPFSTSIRVDEKLKEKENFLLSILSQIWDDTFVLFNSVNPDKRSKSYKNLKKISNLKEFNLQDNVWVYDIIKNKYKDKISSNAINTIINYKSAKLEQIISELDKLFITYDYIDENIIKDNISIEFENSIFELIDDLLNLNINEVILKMNNICESSSVYYFYNSLIANIRTTYYIMKMKSFWDRDIKENLNLWNRWFLLNKRYKIILEKLERLYLSLVKIDENMKSWKLIWSEENDLMFEIEKIIIENIWQM